jgi:hypothetical protein
MEVFEVAGAAVFLVVVLVWPVAADVSGTEGEVGGVRVD